MSEEPADLKDIVWINDSLTEEYHDLLQTSKKKNPSYFFYHSLNMINREAKNLWIIKHEIDNERVGFILYADETRLKFTLIWVHPRHRGSGIASRCQSELEFRNLVAGQDIVFVDAIEDAKSYWKDVHGFLPMRKQTGRHVYVLGSGKYYKVLKDIKITVSLTAIDRNGNIWSQNDDESTLLQAFEKTHTLKSAEVAWNGRNLVWGNYDMSLRYPGNMGTTFHLDKFTFESLREMQQCLRKTGFLVHVHRIHKRK